MKEFIKAFWWAATGWNFLIFIGAGSAFAGWMTFCGVSQRAGNILSIALGVILGWKLREIRRFLKIDKPDA